MKPTLHPHSHSLSDAMECLPLMRKFIGRSQLSAMVEQAQGEGAQFFIDQIIETAKVIKEMPLTHATLEQGGDAIAHLHYFGGGYDAYITERDMGDGYEDDQWQATGVSSFAPTKLQSFIPIHEIIQSGIELDLNWTPIKVKDVFKG